MFGNDVLEEIPSQNGVLNVVLLIFISKTIKDRKKPPRQIDRSFYSDYDGIDNSKST